MKTVKVEYRVRRDYAETNKVNIKAVMEELRGLGDVGVKYRVFVKEDGRSFIHLATTRDEESEAVIPNLDTFKKFREQLSAGAESKPVQESITLIDSSFDLKY